MKKLLITLTLIMAMTGIPASPADAASEKESTRYRPDAALSIPVQQEYTGDRFSGNDSIAYILKAESETNPMPPGAEEGVKTIEATGGKIEFGSITIEEPGAYYYEISRDYEDADGLTHNDQSYRVLVARLSDGSTSITSWDSKTMEKTDSIVFRDCYKDPHGRSPGTGDRQMLLLWGYAAVMLCSSALLLILCIRRKEKRRAHG